MFRLHAAIRWNTTDNLSSRCQKGNSRCRKNSSVCNASGRNGKSRPWGRHLCLPRAAVWQARMSAPTCCYSHAQILS
jgi:hypothetical protein